MLVPPIISIHYSRHDAIHSNRDGNPSINDVSHSNHDGNPSINDVSHSNHDGNPSINDVSHFNCDGNHHSHGPNGIQSPYQCHATSSYFNTMTQLLQQVVHLLGQTQDFFSTSSTDNHLLYFTSEIDTSFLFCCQPPSLIFPDVHQFLKC